MGWDDLENAAPDIRPVDQNQEDINKLCLRVFGDEDGQKLMKWLVQMYVNVPVAVPGADPSYAFYADGQRSVIRELIGRIQKARSM
jgi:hypothetical protein